jgi:hypothetical protein
VQLERFGHEAPATTNPAMHLVVERVEALHQLLTPRVQPLPQDRVDARVHPYEPVRIFVQAPG